MKENSKQQILASQRQLAPGRLRLKNDNEFIFRIPESSKKRNGAARLLRGANGDLNHRPRREYRADGGASRQVRAIDPGHPRFIHFILEIDRKSTRLNSSHQLISYA